MDWHSLFRYDPETGKLFWKVARSTCIKVGAHAGSREQRGYLSVSVNRKRIKVHRIIWDMHNPENKLMPGEQIDHINHIIDDNRLCNLRKTDSTGNHRNMSRPVNNKSGVSGVCWDNNRSKWKAAINICGVTKHIGRFDCFEDAVAARKAAEIKYGFHENHGAEPCR